MEILNSQRRTRDMQQVLKGFEQKHMFVVSVFLDARQEPSAALMHLFDERVEKRVLEKMGEKVYMERIGTAPVIQPFRWYLDSQKRET
jgi:hypothetical protein